MPMERVQLTDFQKFSKYLNNPWEKFEQFHKQSFQQQWLVSGAFVNQQRNTARSKKLRLITLSANQPTFKTVQFNPSGITFILAKQKDPHSNDLRKTFNGVGKSLMVAIINFCLGSSTNTAFAEKLPNWIFYLSIELNGICYTISRATEKQDTISVDGESYSITKFKDGFMGPLCFQIPSEKTNNLTFRNLLPFFLRPKRDSYTDCTVPVTKGNSDYRTCLTNTFFWGLSLDFIRKKHYLKKQIKDISTRKISVTKDSFLKVFLSEEKPTPLTLKAIEKKIERLNHDIEHHEIAENYDDIVKSADKNKLQIDEIRNEIVLLENQLRNINKSLDIKPDLEKESIIELYNEIKTVLSEKVIREITEVESFYSQLIELWSIVVFETC